MKPVRPVCDEASLPRHVLYLRIELEQRKRRNPCYSLRSYARALGIDPSALSRLLRGKQALSLRVCGRIMSRLPIPEEERQAFVESVMEERRQKDTALLPAQAGLGDHDAVLHEMSEVFLRGTDLRSTLRSIARLVVPGFAEGCAIFVLDREGRSHMAEAVHARPEEEPFLRELVMRLMPLQERSDAVSTCLPLRSAERTLGSLVFVFERDSPRKFALTPFLTRALARRLSYVLEYSLLRAEALRVLEGNAGDPAEAR